MENGQPINQPEPKGIRFHGTDGQVVGELRLAQSGMLEFIGDAEPSAKVFMDQCAGYFEGKAGQRRASPASDSANLRRRLAYIRNELNVVDQGVVDAAVALIDRLECIVYGSRK